MSDQLNQDLHLTALSSPPPSELRTKTRASTPKLVRVLVVIPVLNEVDHIEGVIQQLTADLPEHLAVRIAIVDGGSSDGTVALGQRLQTELPEVVFLTNPKKIQASAVNLAVRELGSNVDVLVRADAHTAYPPRFCERLVARLSDASADSVVVPMDSVGNSCMQRAIAWVSNSVVGTGGSAHRAGTTSGFVDHGHHAAFKMETFRKVGGYEETFSHNEDAEFDCRQRAVGARVYLDASLRLSYRPRATLKALGAQYFKYGRGRSRTVRRHPKSWRLRQMVVPAHCLVCMGCVLGGIVAPILWVYPGAYLGALGLISLGFLVQKRSSCGLLTGPAAFVMHFGWAAGFLDGWLRYRERPWQPEVGGV